jgi:diguanylate cyclase (GGDEF)-like protein
MQTQAVPPSIAVIIDRNGTYQSSVLRGVHDFLGTVGWSASHYFGRELDMQDELQSGANDIYSLINTSNHAGILILTGTVGNNCSNPQLRHFLQQFKPLPVVSFGRKLPGIPSILINNHSGMTQLMSHLIKQRQFRRFCFVRGRRNNPQSQERERSVQSSLKAYGIDLPESHLLTGNFEASTARAAMLEFLKSHPNSIDCVVCANDDMAQAIIQTLQEQGIRVPEDIAVTGFDDVPESHYTLPTLTTVRQPLFEQGVAAARILYNMVHNLPHDNDLSADSQVVVRESCGNTSNFELNLASSETFEHLPLFQRQTYHDWIDELLTSGTQTQRFIRQMKTCFEQDLKENRELDLWYSVLETWRQKAIQDLPADDLLKFEAQNKIICAVLMGTMKLAITQLRASRQVQTIFENQIAISLSGHETVQDMMNALKGSLTELGLRNHVLVLYQEFGLHPAPTSRIWIHSESKNVDLQPFHTQNLLPENMRDQVRTGNWNIHPLYIHEEHYGYIMLDQPEHWGYDGESLAHLISQGIHEVVKTQSLKQYSQSLEQQVRIRTEQIEQANLELQRSLLLDGLTGIYNRAAFDDYLGRMWNQHCKSQTSLSLLMCDVDFFKKYNDRYGHLQGDYCLRVIAKAIAESAPRPRDFTARYGGEEFVVILPETDYIGAMRVAERIQKQVALLCLPHQGLEQFDMVTLSIGIETMIPNAFSSKEVLMQRSDLALYQAKKHRNQIVVAA